MAGIRSPQEINQRYLLIREINKALRDKLDRDVQIPGGSLSREQERAIFLGLVDEAEQRLAAQGLTDLEEIEGVVEFLCQDVSIHFNREYYSKPETWQNYTNLLYFRLHGVVDTRVNIASQVEPVDNQEEEQGTSNEAFVENPNKKPDLKEKIKFPNIFKRNR